MTGDLDAGEKCSVLNVAWQLSKCASHQALFAMVQVVLCFDSPTRPSDLPPPPWPVPSFLSLFLVLQPSGMVFGIHRAFMAFHKARSLPFLSFTLLLIMLYRSSIDPKHILVYRRQPCSRCPNCMVCLNPLAHHLRYAFRSVL